MPDMASTSRPMEPPVEDSLVEACLGSLRGLGPAVRATYTRRREPARADGELHLQTARTRTDGERFVVETTRSHLSYALVGGLISRMPKDELTMLFAPYVPGPIGGHLAEHRMSYVDAIGNCHVTVRGELLAHVEGKKPPRVIHARSAGRAPAHQLVLAILARPELLQQPVRRLAEAAGIGKTAAAEQLARLKEQGLLVATSRGPRIVRPRQLLDRWLAAYADIVRPNWIVGRYRTQSDDPEQLEAKIQGLDLQTPWALGGGAAAWRMTHFYRGVETVLHVASPPDDLARRLRAMPSRDGPLTILRTPGTVAYEGVEPHLANPLLVYTEMLVSNDPRMIEAAAELRPDLTTESP